MRSLRGHLTCVLSLWIVCQVAALGAPVVLAATGSAPAEQLCTCPGGDHETCPMHHSRQTDSESGACGMSRACAPLDVALLSLAGGAGILPSTIQGPLFDLTSAVPVDVPFPIDTPVSFDTPPPRL